MHIIKLNAIDSTNNYLKKLVMSSNPENLTIVTTDNQTDGKGQMGSKWISEPGKNLIMSMYYKNVKGSFLSFFTLNIAVALAVKKALFDGYSIQVSIKWPNDIMAGKKKLGGILIENVFKSDTSVDSIIGLGLNVNQTDFKGLPNATSILLETAMNIDRQRLLLHISEQIIKNLSRILTDENALWEEYQASLYKKNIPAAFEDCEGTRFMGLIHEVTREGKLALLLSDNSVRYFEVKQVRYLD